MAPPRAALAAARRRARAQSSSGSGGGSSAAQQQLPMRRRRARDGALRRRVTALLCFGAALAREAAAQSQCETGEANLDAVTAAWGGRDPYPFAAQSCETTNDADAEAAGARAARCCARPPLAPR